MEWVREGINYWCNPDCPREYLEKSLLKLIEEVECERLPADHFKDYKDEDLRAEVSHYEYVSDK